MSNRIEVILGDITTQRVDAIVNAANSYLRAGGGVCGDICTAAGHELIDASRALNGCKTGEAKITKGFRLPAKYIIHAVGPIWEGGDHGEKELLYAAYANSLKLAVEYEVKTIAFPSISTGNYGYPLQEAAPVAVGAIQDFLSNDLSIEKVTIVCFNEHAYATYKKAVEEWA